MNTKIIYITIFIIMLSVASAYSQEAELVSMSSLVEEALKNSPRIEAAYNNWQAQEYKITQVKSLPDPMASYTYFGENVETRVGPQEHKYGASQKIPFPGKLGLKGKAQGKQAQILKERYEALKREVIKNVKFTYYDIFWVDRAVQVTEEEKAILESLEKVAQRRYELNLTPQQDVIKAQVEISKLIDRLFLLRQNRVSLAAKMNSILNRPKGTKLNYLEPVIPDEFSYKLSTLHDISRDSRQELIAAKLAVERAEYEKSLAKLNYLPDVTFGFDYIQVGGGETARYNDGDDAWMGKVAINVPIWFDKLGAQVKEKEASLEAGRQNYEDLKSRVGYEIEDLYVKITTYKDIILLYKTALVPQAEQAFEAARIGYETANVDFLNWIDSERVLLQTRLAYYKAIVDYQKSIAYLEKVIGIDI